MRRASVMVLIPLALTGCITSSPPPASTVTIVRAPSPTIQPTSPTPPPPPMVEQAPPPPNSTTRTVWQPGHWRYTGIAGHLWNWQNGQYAAVPAGANAWIPGQWLHQDGQWVWQQGHWS